LGIGLVLLIKRRQLRLTVEEILSVTWLTGLGHTKTTLELTSSSACVDVLRSGNDDLLLLVVVCSTLTLVLGLLNGGFLVAFVQVLDDVSVKALDFLLEARHTLDLARIHASRKGLGRNLVFDGALDRWHGDIRDATIVEPGLELLTLHQVSDGLLNTEK
jgi:hypothetical protein